MPMTEEAIVMMFLGSFSIFMVANGLTLLKKEIYITTREEKQTQTQDDEEYPGIEYVEIPEKKTKSSCLVM